jgi:hypothetical protein
MGEAQRRYVMPAKTHRHHFTFRVSNLGQVLLVPYGVGREKAFVEIRGDKLHVRFGPMFDERFPLSEIEDVAPAHWPLWAGLGPRTNFRGAVGLVGSYSGTVRVRFKSPQDVRLFVAPVKCDRLYLSLEHPDDFATAIGEAREETPRRLAAA